MLEKCRECHQPTPEENMRGSLCLYCFDHVLSNDELDKEFAQRLEDGWDLMHADGDDDGDDDEDWLDGFMLLKPSFF